MMSDFFQTPPKLGNQYDEDRLLKSYLKWKLPSGVLLEIQPELQRLGQRVTADIFELGQAAEASPPELVQFDPWGKRIDQIIVSPAWQELDHISAEEKLVAIGYERTHGALSRIHQFAKIYLFHPSSAIYTCPLAMTDGAARTLEIYGSNELKQHALAHLVSSNPNYFWTSGQWMTERTGGSDVSGTTTIAKPHGNYYQLYGSKWFTSATTSQMAMTLARIEGSENNDLSLFYLELHNEDGTLNNIQINRLKNKLGTHALPTAELELRGSKAVLIGEEGNGVKKISALFNITRVYNACSAVGYMRRAIALARSYAYQRRAFGHSLAELPLHLETLANLQIEFTAAFHLCFRTIELLGKEETGEASEEESATLRLLTPIVKLYTAKQAISIVSEALECFGGAGYIEDTGLPHLLRDTQVLSIWEGTTNVLSLDALRAIRKQNAAEHCLNDIENRLTEITLEDLLSSKEITQKAVEQLRQFTNKMSTQNDDALQLCARSYAFSLAQIYSASLMLEHAQWAFNNEHDKLPLYTAHRWCGDKLTQPINAHSQYAHISQMIALDKI